MADSTQSSSIQPDERVQVVSELHGQPYREATPVQRFLDAAVANLSHPALVVVLALAVVGWISLNLAILWTGGHPLDPPPFQWLQAAASVTAVHITALILTTQHREDGFARHRDQLTLELAILGERKSAKIIELLEELRRDSPHVQDRIDIDAAAMATPTDPGAVLTAIKEVSRVIAEEKN